jgi:hypothetical protein
MKIKYAGSRPIISQHGISYKDGKDDKYIYLMTALEILQDIDNNYEENKSYSRYISQKPLEEKEFHERLLQYDIHLEEEVNIEIQNYKQKIKQEIIDVQNMTNITQIEKDTWCNNLELMTQYRIQRAINKIYYFHCISDIKEIIIHKRIKKIETPFNEKYWHVLSTIQGSLENGKNSYSTKLVEKTKDNNMMIILEIIY